MEPLTVPPARPDSETSPAGPRDGAGGHRARPAARRRRQGPTSANCARRLPVPAGFCLTTQAYRRATRPRPRRGPRRPGRTAPDDPGLARLAAAARSSSWPPTSPPTSPPRSPRPTRAGRGDPGGGRSSATAEDLPFASFAGQQDTYLNVVGADACSTRSAAAGRRCGPTGPSPTAPTTGSTTRRSGSPWWSSRWSTRRSPGCCSPPTRSAGGAASAVLDASPGLGEAVVSGAVNPDHFVVDGPPPGRATGGSATSGRGARRCPAAAPSRSSAGTPDAAACLDRPPGARRSPRWAAGSRRTSARRRTSSGRSTPRARSGSPSRGRSPRLYPVPPSAPRRGAARVPLRQPGPGADPADHADGAGGVRGARPRRWPAVRPPGPSRPRWRHRRLFADGRAAAVRRRHRRCCATRSAGRSLPRVLDVHGGPLRGGAARAARRPALRPGPGARRRALRRDRAGARAPSGVPLLVAQALACSRPPRTAGSPGCGARGAGVRPPAAAGRPPAARAGARRRCLARPCRCCPGALPAVAAGFLMLAARGRLLGDRPGPARLATVLRGLPAQRHHRDGPGALGAGAARSARTRTSAARCVAAPPAAELAAGSTPAPCPGAAGRARGVPAPLRPPRRRRDRPRHAALVRQPDHVLGVLANYLRLTTTRRRTRRRVRPRARRRPRRRSRTSSPGRGGAVRRAAAGRASPCAGPARWSGCASAQGPPRPARSPPPGPSWPPSAPSWPPRACSTPPTTSSSSTCARSAPPSTAPTCAALVASAGEEYARELRRRHVPRVLLSDGTEPEALARPGAPDDGALVGTPASAGTVTGAARVVLDPVGARLEPGRDPRRTVHRPRLDAAVPHRGRRW